MKNITNKKISEENYYPALDGLRGLAVLMIIFYHNFDYLRFTSSSWIGLDLFFVLSGFLITEILLKKRNSSHFLKNFYTRRALRILPVYYLSIFLFLFVLPRIIQFHFSIQYFLMHQQWFWLEIQNWLFILKPDGNNNYLNHFWSLALEEQFYLFSPVIILLIKPIQKFISFLFFVLLLVIMMRLILWNLKIGDISYINLYAFTRVDGLCIGSLLAIFKYQGTFELSKFNRTLALIFISLAFIILPFFKIILHSKLPYRACCLFPAISIFWGLIVWSSIRGNSVIKSFFDNGTLKYFGKISYGLYIFHWPIDRIIRSSQVSYGWLDNLYLSIMATALAILSAIISYYSIEKYFLSLKRHFN